MKRIAALLIVLAFMVSFALAEETVIRQADVIDPTLPMVALTFDDGPSEYTFQILELLEKYNCHATFCMVGNRMGGNAEAVQAVAESGNDIASHAWAHEKLTTLSEAGMKRVLSESINKITTMTGREVHYLRPPYGARDNNVCRVASSLGLAVVTWSLDTRDWESRNAEAIFKMVRQQVEHGDIILCHDAYQSTVDGVALFLPWLIENGYQVLSLEEIFSYYEGGAVPGKVYYHADPAKLTVVPE